jgi:hypothetical protein
MAFGIITPAQLGQGSIGIAVSTFHTVPTLTRSIVKSIDLCNTTAAPVRLTVYLVPSGGSASAANTLIPNVSLLPYGVMQWFGSQVLNEGDTIQAVAAAVGCTINVSGGLAV